MMLYRYRILIRFSHIQYRFHFEQGKPTMQAIFRNRWLPYLLLLPTMIILVLFLYYPILSTFSLSFNKAAPNGITLTYIGFDNYSRLLDPQITRNDAGTLLI